jgi:hypothetical protein
MFCSTHLQGYEDGLSTLHKPCPAETFVDNSNFLDVLATNSQLTFAPDRFVSQSFFCCKHDMVHIPPAIPIVKCLTISVLLNEPETTLEIKQLCSDLKVLGKSDFKYAAIPLLIWESFSSLVLIGIFPLPSRIETNEHLQREFYFDGARPFLSVVRQLQPVLVALFAHHSTRHSQHTLAFAHHWTLRL